MRQIERPKVFLVDDNVGLRSMLRELLAEAGVGSIKRPERVASVS
jgi:hypothetical protein